VGTHRSKPAQGRATFTMSVLRWRYGGGIYCPSPSPPGFPLLKDKNRRGLLYPGIPRRSTPSGRKPVP
jgi:hypothetical protein